jgi:hypothetical protein
MDKIKFAIEFGGFYDSVHSSIIEDQIEFSGIDYEEVDYKGTHENYARNYLKALNDTLGLNVEFSSLWSPLFYNFQTDTIMGLISVKEFKELKEMMLENKEFIKWADKSSQSRDGFISFCSGIEELKKDEVIMLEYIFTYLIHIEDDNFNYEIIADFDFEIVFSQGTSKYDLQKN